MFNTLAILYTMKCTAKCRICCFDCTPERNEKLSVEQVKSYIDKASALKSIHTIGFSGGEALLYIDELCELAQYANSRGIYNISVNTNGFWATTEEKAYNVLDKLYKAGFTKIGLSSDDFHQEYVPSENIKNLLDASVNFNISIDLGVMISENSRRLSQVLSSFGENISNKVIMQYPVLPAGSAKTNNISAKKRKLVVNETFLCRSLKYLAVYPNGDVYPCCSQIGRNQMLKIGNLNTDTINDIKKKYNSNMIIRILKKHGFSWFVDRTAKYDKEYAGMCELCNDIIKDEKVFNKIFGADIELEKMKIYEEYIKRNSPNDSVE